jgi:hypothetical protein
MHHASIARLAGTLVEREHLFGPELVAALHDAGLGHLAGGVRITPFREDD